MTASLLLMNCPFVKGGKAHSAENFVIVVDVALSYFGKRLEEAMARVGVGPVELHRLTGIPQSTISSWLNTFSSPPPSRPDLVRLAEVLGVPVEEVREWARISWHSQLEPAVEHQAVLEMEQEVIALLRELHPDDRVVLLRAFREAAREYLRQARRRARPGMEAVGSPPQAHPTPASR